jgi:hypothetical protein
MQTPSVNHGKKAGVIRSDQRVLQPYHLIRWAFHHELITVLFCFFPGRVLPSFSEPLEQDRNLRLTARLSQRYDQMIKGCLIAASVSPDCR